MLDRKNAPSAEELAEIVRKQAAVIARERDAKRRALAIANERSKENAELRAENRRLNAELEKHGRA